MKYGRDRKYTDRCRLVLCTSARTNGKPCRNKACTNTPFCHMHTPGRAIKRRVPCHLLVHLFYLYGMRDVEMERIEEPWKWMSRAVFGGLVAPTVLQSHDNRYRRFMERRALTRADTRLEVVYGHKRVAGVHRYHEFNQLNLAEHIDLGSVVEVRGVPYQFRPDGLRRCDAVGAHMVKHDFRVLFGLNGYTLQGGVWVHAGDGLCTLQRRCLQTMFSTRLPDAAPPEPAAPAVSVKVEPGAFLPRPAVLDMLAHAWFLHGLDTAGPRCDAVSHMHRTIFHGMVAEELLRDHASRYAAWRARHFSDAVFDMFPASGVATFVHQCVTYTLTGAGVIRLDEPNLTGFVAQCALAGFVLRGAAWVLHPQLQGRAPPAAQGACQRAVFDVDRAARTK
jgi:hypothetical protein